MTPEHRAPAPHPDTARLEVTDAMVEAGVEAYLRRVPGMNPTVRAMVYAQTKGDICAVLTAASAARPDAPEGA
jgi:hypothetical protein